MIAGCSQTPENLSDMGIYTQEQASQKPVIEIFSDSQCSHCKSLNIEIQKIKTEFPKVEVKEYMFPFLGAESYNSAIAVECVKVQNEKTADTFLNQIFALPAQTNESRKTLASNLSLDMTAYEKCVSDKATKDTVAATISEGKKRGVKGTPAIFIKGQEYKGGRTPEDLKKAFSSVQ